MNFHKGHPIKRFRISVHLGGNDNPVWVKEIESDGEEYGMMWLGLYNYGRNILDAYIATARATNAYPQYKQSYPFIQHMEVGWGEVKGYHVCNKGVFQSRIYELGDVETEDDKPKRPDWRSFFLGIAEAVSRRSSCPRAKCGCVLVDPDTNHVLSMGYNGAPPGEPHCIDEGCIMVEGHCQRAIHSEVNAVAHAARNGVNIDGSHAYIYAKRQDGETKKVCRECDKVLKAANITVMACTGDI